MHECVSGSPADPKDAAMSEEVMKYITGTHALNLPSPTDTVGDWHYSSVDWARASFWDTQDSVYHEWGIYQCEVPGKGVVMAADHVRAVLDLIEKGYFSSAQGMRDELISNERYTSLIFEKVSELCGSEGWPSIDAFMGKEYLCDWLAYKERRGM
jgi:hypothetical protein